MDNKVLSVNSSITDSCTPDYRQQLHNLHFVQYMQYRKPKKPKSKYSRRANPNQVKIMTLGLLAAECVDLEELRVTQCTADKHRLITDSGYVRDNSTDVNQAIHYMAKAKRFEAKVKAGAYRSRPKRPNLQGQGKKVYGLNSTRRAPWKNRTSQYISFFFSAHHSMVFYFRCSVYWWKGSVRF